MPPTIDPTSAAIYARILAEPDEDSHRLVWADRLDELNGPGDAARAEFVRVQVELEGCPDPLKCPSCGGELGMQSMTSVPPLTRCRDCPLTHGPFWAEIQSRKQTRDRLLAREAALLAANAADFRLGLACEKCRGTGNSGALISSEGHGRTGKTVFARCLNCAGTGDGGGLTERVNHERQVDQTSGGTHTFRHTDWRHQVDFRRGFPDVVHATWVTCVTPDPCSYCMAGTQTLFHGPGATNPYTRACPRCDGRGSCHVASDWARRVVRCHPLKGFRVTDREPAVQTRGGVVWYPQRAVGGVPPGDYVIPTNVWDRIEGGLNDRNNWFKWFPTPEAAHAALGATLVAIAREGHT